jgi:predicted RNA binding protein YcfA (HicA-like mRNA interferase family)
MREHNAGHIQRQATVKVRDVLKLLAENGWFLVRQKGSHRIFHHAEKPGSVTVAGQPGQDVAIGTWKSILRQAGIKEGD